jgi:hypothetical protein
MVGSGGVKRCGGGAISTLDSSVIVGKYTIIKINNNKYALVLGFTTKYSYISVTNINMRNRRERGIVILIEYVCVKGDGNQTKKIFAIAAQGQKRWMS